MNNLVQLTIGDLLTRRASETPDAPAVIGNRQSLTYRQLDEASDRSAMAFCANGIVPGTHTGIYADDNYHLVIGLFALWKIGAVPVLLSTGYKPEEMAYAVKAADLSFICTDTEKKRTVLKESFLLNGQVLAMPDLNRLTDPDLSPLTKEQADRLNELRASVKPESIDTILFTSGSSGNAKPVVTTHISRVNTGFAQARAIRSVPSDIYCSVLPLFHCFSLTANLMSALCAGACVCFPDNRHGHTILETIEKYRCTILNSVPTLFGVLMQRLGEKAYDISSLRTGVIGGSTYTPDYFKKICSVLDIDLLPSLGQSEATAGLTGGSPDDSLELRASTLGKLYPGVEGKVISLKDGTALPAGQTGEFCIRGFNVMKGYYKMPEETAKALDKEGWLHTGDLVHFDQDGYFYYDGRSKELIIRGGENISPIEIESKILDIKGIEKVKVIGIPDPHYTEKVCACVIAAPGVTEQTILSDLKKRIADYKLPEYILFFDSFPMISISKTNAHLLKEMAMERLGMK